MEQLAEKQSNLFATMIQKHKLDVQFIIVIKGLGASVYSASEVAKVSFLNFKLKNKRSFNREKKYKIH